MSDRLAQALTKLYEKHRIVFWYDQTGEFEETYEQLAIDNVEKLTIANNQFQLKYRLLRQQPEQNFLLYHNGPAPADAENWLLDVELAHGVFAADQTALWLAELGLGPQFTAAIAAHGEFCHAAKRLDALKKMVNPATETSPDLLRKMAAICTQADPRLDAILENLLAESAQGKSDRFTLLQRCNLETWLWEQLHHAYGYDSPTLTLTDFTLTLFKAAYLAPLTGKNPLTEDAIVFLQRWRDSSRHRESFRTLSQQCAHSLNIVEDLQRRDLRDLMRLDYFAAIDQKIIDDLVQGAIAATLHPEEVNQWIHQRQTSHWYGDYRHLYEAIAAASLLSQSLELFDPTIHSPHHGVERYVQSWYRIDQAYRHYTFHARQCSSADLAPLTAQLDQRYSNHYLSVLGDRWQTQIDSLTHWQIPNIKRQDQFFRHWVEPYLKKNKKVCVIISDALRYEVGVELVERICQEDRYEAQIEPALAMLPSYTRLGMAALLPHEQLSFGYQATITVDGQSSQGIENRAKILQKHRATAIQAEDFWQLDRDESRELLKNHEVLYVYHNHIDKVGDQLASEDRVFEAVQKTCEELVDLLKKLANANGNNFLITADHGFLYQRESLSDSDFSQAKPQGKILYENRRFILGENLQPTPGLHHFTAQALGIHSAIDVQIPKSINRLRLKGSGSKFVHGGAMLQEVIIPVIKVNKKRTSDTRPVKVTITEGGNTTITTGQLAVLLYQEEPVTAKIKPQTLRIGLYTAAGEPISNTHELCCDRTSSHPQDREFRLQFLLTREANTMNNVEIYLHLEAKQPHTSHYQLLDQRTYWLRRTFTTDFDF